MRSTIIFLKCRVLSVGKIAMAKDVAWSVWNKDALESALPAADCIVCDPPYKLTTGGGRSGDAGRMSGIFDLDNYDNGGQIVPCEIDWDDFMGPCFDALRDPGHAYFMANNRNVQPMLNAAEKAGFHFHNLLVWDKITATPNRWYMKNLEFTGFFSKGNAFYINDCSQKQLIRCPQKDESFGDSGKPHPTEKPVSLMKSYIINSTKPGEIVLDPFMGSGSTGVAALQAGRRFIGIEKEEKYFDMAVDRLQAALLQGSFSL